MSDFSLLNFVTRVPRNSSGVYPEARERKVDRVHMWLAAGTYQLTRLFRPLMRRRMQAFARQVEASEARFLDCSDAELLEQAQALGRELRFRGLDDAQFLAPQFALIREVSFRRLGMRHFQTQVMSGWCMLHGQIAEMATGEGKTLTIGIPAAAAALSGIPVHVITVNDYLTQRDADFLRPVYEALGLSVGVIIQGMSPDERREAYDCDITYCTNKELAFDYLKDRLALGNRPGPLRMIVQRLFDDHSGTRKSLLRGLHFAIVDEADSVLVDEARTPLIISGTQQSGGYDEAVIHAALDIARGLQQGVDFELDEALRKVDVTEEGDAAIEAAFNRAPELWSSALLCEDMVHKALTGLHVFRRDEDYLVRDGEVEIIDEYTGRAMSGRQWSKGLHQLVEAKEGCELSDDRQTLSKISYQRFFRRYRSLAGMTGTANEAAGELWAVYRLPILPIPTYRPCRRVESPGKSFTDSQGKWAHVLDMVKSFYEENRPLLIGVRSVSTSEHLSGLLTAASIPHQLLNARNEAEEADLVAKAGEQGKITIATNMAGRGTDIKLAEGVEESGGLFVLIVERFEAKRIDRQLIGRCARQGDPGGFCFVLSLDDPLLDDLRIGMFLRWLKTVFRNSPGLLDRFGYVIQRMAQLRMERMHYRMRKQVLRSDQDTDRMLSFSGYSE